MTDMLEVVFYLLFSAICAVISIYFFYIAHRNRLRAKQAEEQRQQELIRAEQERIEAELQERKKQEEQNRKEKEEREGESEMILENVTNEEKYTTYHIHILKEGETIETICTMYNSNLSILSEYNDLSNVQEGEKIIIPDNDES